jgi:amino acid adenylation domain-containing protein/non-ribosomal peptide synthase protein (TIGR01720 family)
MSAMAVMARCRSENLGVTVENIITCKSIRHLATLATKPQLPEREDNEDNHEFDLSPIQNLYFRCMEGNSTRFNQSILLRLRMSVSDDFVRGCISGIMKIHSMLRARFHRDANGIWKQHISSDAEGSYTFRARTVYQPSDISGEIENIQNVVNIVDGPLVGVALFKHGSGSAELFICAHHLVVDVVSWDIILQDLENLFQQKVASGGEGTSFRKWCRLQSDKAKRDKSVKVLPLEDVPVADFAYWGMDGKSNLHGDAITEDIQFDLVTTNQLLQICRGTLRVDFVDLLLASLLVSFCRVFPDRDRPPAIYNEGHGRESGVSSIELSRTVGWFTTFCPIHIPHDTGPHDDCDLLQCISWVKQLRNRIPDKGAAYFAQRLLTWEGNEKYGKHWPMEIAFNYLGKHNASEASDTMLELINGTGQSVNSCSDIEPLVPRFALIDISAAVVQGHLNLSFSYNKLMARQTEIQKWASVCRDLLGETLVNLPSETCQVGSSDFRLLPLSYNSLNKLKGGLLNVGISSFDGVEDVYPCSQMQEGILLSQLKDPHTYAYQAIFEVQTRLGESSVNLERLDAAWQEVVQRHAALRTIFVDGSHESSFIDQVVLKLTDARALVLGCDDADARSFLSNIEIIDFRNGRPPVRLALCKTRSGRVFARFDTTNAVCDGSSIPIILRDISRSYFRLPPVTLERPLYSDFISHLQSIPKERGIKYWKEYLAGTEPCVLPSMTTGRESAKRLGSHIFVLDSFSEAQNFCKNVGVTTSALLQLVWGLVLRCYTGSDDICFGYISSGRDASVKGIRDAVGAFINMLIYKIDLSNDLSVGDTMKRTQLDFVRSMEHQSVSLAEVQHELGLSEVALFNTVFTFQRRNEIEQDSISALSFTSFETSDASEYKLAINVEMTESITEVHMSYWVNYLSEQQVQNIADTFQQTVQDIIQQNNTELRIGDIDFFGSHSCNKVREWNCSLKERENRCVHELIDERVHLQSPEATAIQGWDASFTYEELSSATNRLAISLIQRGVGPEVYVPLCFEKSAWAIVAQLAVLKAGGAFVSLDPSHPEDRLRGLLDDVRGTLVLSSALQSDKVSRICDQVIILDQKTIQELQNQLTSLSSPASPSNSAYVIFTSGSTGKPKGTIIEHAQLCTSALAQGKALHMTSESRVIQFASYTFDASIMEIFTTLIAGGCVCVPSDEDRMNDIAGAVSRHRANWMFSTPSVANTLKPDSIPSVKVFLMGGEKLTQGIIERWAKSACVVEAYGPSECAVVCASDEKADMNGQIVNSDPSTIGRAVGSRSWIVDQRDFNHLVPVGAVGELVIEGHIVGRGYLNDERKTNESFIQDPQWATSVGFRGLIRPGSRMYRTGDLVRYNTDGSISYVARKDMQIKLNGQRVELGEIEYQCSLRMPEHVQLAVDLIAPALQAGAKKLAMFFAIEQDGEAGQRIDRTNDQLELLQMSPSIRNMTRKLGKSLAKILPSYMIPQLFFPVSLLPITTSGKLDRRKLHAEVQVLSIETLKSYSLLASMQGHSPENQMQEMLQGLWGEVLGIPRSSINIEDSFFRIGGDSLAVMKLTGRARSRGISLSAVDIFRYPILKDLAEKCGKSKNTKFTTLKPFDLVNKSEPLDEVINEVASHCGVDRAIISDIYPCSPLQEGLITSSVRQSGAYVNQNVFRLSDEIEISKFKASWQQLVDEFDLLRTRIVHTASSNFLQVVLKQQVISWHNAECLEELTGDYMALPETDGGLLTKYTLVQDRGSSSLYFVWSIHHALYDAWGLSIILQRVKELYFSTASSMKSAPYANFIDYLQKRDTSASDTFWKTHLSNLSPNSFPNTSNTSDKRVSKIISAAVEISDAISSMDLTIPNLIRAAWAVVLSSRTQSMDVYFGETLTGRNIDVPGITDMAGPVLTTVPTRLQVNPEMEIKEYLMEVQRISTEIIPHQHSGLQHIKRLSRDAALACDFQNLIVVQTAEDTLGNSLWEVQDDHTIVSFFTYPLVVECKVSNGSIPVNIHYDEKAITTWEAEKLLQQFSYLLQQLSSFNDFDGEKLGNLDMVSPEDRKEISQWNRRNPELVDECIHGLFRQKCDSNPHAAGVHAWDGDLTYRELDEYASAVAGYLRSLGVKPEVFVPICLEKSAWTIVIMFGVLMAGGAIVPLDPSHPLSRHQEILEELGTNFIIFSPQYSARYTDIVQHAIAMDGQVISNLPQTSRSHRHIDDAVGSNAAYAIFTSGSTGKAKGITVDHRAFASSSKSFGSAMRMDSGSRVLQFASLSFDAALLEIFTTLTVGGCICIPNEEDRLKDLSGTICRMTVSWTLLTPSVANLIDPSSVPHLKVLVCGGEAMSPEIIARWSDQVHLINAYGPSEASVVATINPSVSNESPSCIGYGTQSTLTWVVNAEDYNELSPLGTVGELALEGPTLARGYLNDSIKTRASFVDNPAWVAGFPSALSGTRRIHLTGDLVKYRHDGSLEYVGRKDSQVKLHGQRMDLGEIEQRLDAVPRVRHVIVIMPKTGHFQKRLIAIISLHSSSINNSVLSVESCELVTKGQQVDSELAEIKDCLSKQLPSYMLPQAWAIVSRLPMLVSGKLDRKKVKNWVESLSEETYQMIAGIHGEDEHAVEATGVTATLQDIWAQVLNLPREKVKLNRSFLSLGMIHILFKSVGQD